ncbi:MAG: MMPL family transporter, partial [Bacteroidetes bacterium]|nr:MMPL family transporter [Bacteroidota bacterium]
MWERIAAFVLKNRLTLLLLLLAATAFMGWEASKVQLSYDFSRAVPTDNPKYVSYQNFRRQFGEDGNLMAIGLQTDHLFTDTLFNDYRQLNNSIRQVKGVEDVLSVTSALNLVKDSATERLQARPLFPAGPLSQSAIDSGAHIFLNLPFYRGLLYNPESHTYLSAVRINKDVLNSKERNTVVSNILAVTDSFNRRHGVELHYSGLPHIRTSLAIRIAAEMKLFLIGSIILLALILLIFFRSISTVLLSLAVVLIGVVWSMGTIQLMGYKITLLIALIPTLVVVIGIPNCVYFLNKYHISYNDTRDKKAALAQMIS